MESGISEVYSAISMMNELNGKRLLAPPAGCKSIPPPKHVLLFNSNINLHVTYDPRNDDN